ncbi:MAG: Gfo/Idh/MocA family oxidoreductase [Verrucomicrobia bacterium]|nr:Gfo/Idh/MocA family oxidoreductase [Verrucomicrobiota bacterium]
MTRIGIIGLGKMGSSHLAIAAAHPEVEIAGICDPGPQVVEILEKHTRFKGFKDYRKMLESEKVDAVVISTPSKTHGQIVRDALNAGADVFCEKPFVLDVGEGEQLVDLAATLNRVTQVGYCYRFVAAFEEARRVVESGALGRVHHVRAQAYGPVVLKAKGGTWRSAKSEGGGCLYDYAIHTIDLLNMLVGPPQAVDGVVLSPVFSSDVDDEVYATIRYGGGLSGQLAVNWSDDSQRKMRVQIEIWGEKGRINVDRQECQVYLRQPSDALPGYAKGWNIRYTTDLTPPVGFFLRGEEYSAQIDYFVKSVKARRTDGISNFASALEADRFASMLRKAGESGEASGVLPVADRTVAPRRSRLMSLLFGRGRGG